MTPFRLVDAHSAADAVALLRMHGPHAQAIASGGDLLGLLKEGVAGPALASPAVLVNLATAPELARIAQGPAGLRLGAMATLVRLRQEPDMPPMLAEAIAHIASPQLRARTTLGGNLLQRPRCLYFRHPDVPCFKKGGTGCPAQSGPAEAYPGALFPGACHAGHPSDLAPVLIALDAQAEVAGPGGLRTLPLIDLYRDAAFKRERETALAPDELLAAVIVPHGTRTQAFEKVAPRAANEFSWAGAAVVIERDGECIAGVRIVLSGIAPGPYLFERAGDLLVGQRANEVDAEQVAYELVQIEPATPSMAMRVSPARLAISRALSRALRQPSA